MEMDHYSHYRSLKPPAAPPAPSIHSGLIRVRSIGAIAQRHHGALPADICSARHDVAAGDDEPNRQRGKPAPDDSLPQHVAEAIPQTCTQ
jgi:hypothetical protein